MNSRVNSGRGFVVPQEIDVQIGRPWIPLTPGKPILGKPNGIPVERQVSQPGRTSWRNLARVPDRALQQTTTNYQGTGQNFDLSGSLGQNGSCYDLHVSGAEMGSNHNAGSFTELLGNGIESTIWDNNPLAELFATKNGEATSRRSVHESNAPTILNSYSQVDSSWTDPNFTRLLMEDDDLNPDPNNWITANRLLLPEITSNGFPVPFRPNYNPNSPPRSDADATSSTANSFPFAPVTPDHAKQFENHRCSAMPSFSVEESSSQEKDKLENLLTNEAAENNNFEGGNQLLQNIVGSSAAAAAVSLPLSENNNFEGGNQGIDLNKTPQLKGPKRRKHRPKVIVEGKPKRVPKSKTSKNNTKENPSGKRKYVRRKSLNAPANQQTDATNEATVVTFESKAKTSRRKLNFDSEDRKGESKGKAASLPVKIHEENQGAFNLKLGSQGSDLCTRINSVNGAEAAEKEMQNGYKEGYKQVESACTLKHSMNQMSDESTQLPERGAPAGSPVASKNNKLNAIARMRNAISYNGYSYQHQHLHGELNRHISQPCNAHQNLEEITQVMWQNTPHMVERNMAHFNEKRGLKREYHHEIRLPGISAENQMSYPFTYQDIYWVHGRNNNSHDFCTGCSETHKKIITENGSREVAPGFYSRMLDCGFGNDKTFKKIKNGVNGTCGDRPFHSSTSEHNNTQKQLTASELHTETMAEKKPNGSTQVHDSSSLIAMATSHLVSSTPLEKKPTSGYEQRIEACGENMLVKRCSMAQTSSNLVSSCINKVLLQEHKDGSHDCQQSSLKTRDQPKKQEYSVTIAEITWRLQRLNITGRSKETDGQEQNAIVAYKGYGTMVPYEAFDLIKKRKPRPKVDLDPETNRIWKLLMGGEGIEGTEADAKNKEKWWDEERKVFRGRADSFIARMHLVQGDRRFSQWKGSVVDSVIGVFLTQNVSDHLSSSAFMSLAARFPLQSTTPDQTCYQSGTSIKCHEILDPDGTIKCHEKRSRQSGYEQPSSVAYHESSKHRTEDRTSGGARRTSLATEHIGIVEEKASSSQNSSDFFVFQANKEMQSCSRTEEPTSVAGRTSPATKHSGIWEEKATSSQNSSDFFGFRSNKEMQSCSRSTSEAEDLSGGKPNNMYGSSTLLQMKRSAQLQVFHSPATGSLYFDGRSAHWHKQSEDRDCNLEIPTLDKVNNLKNSSTFTHPTNSNISRIQEPTFPSRYFKLHTEPELTTQKVGYFGMCAEESISSSPSSASGITRGKGVNHMNRRIDNSVERKRKTTVQQNGVPMIQPPTIDPSAFLTKHLTHRESCSQSAPHTGKDQLFFSTHQQERSSTFKVESALDKEPIRPTEAVATAESGTRYEVPNNFKYMREALGVEKRTTAEDNPRFLETKVVEANAKEQVYFSGETPTGMNTDMLNARKGKAEGEKSKPFDWDSLRKQVGPSGRRKERNKDALDSLDYEAIRCADVNEIANAIKERGMNNMLAERIKAFLNRLVRDHGSIDLEWLRDVPPDKAKDYLLSIRGLGLKSVECVRLLSLHHLAFPVDTNVGRIAVRLGWVPLQPLPESLQLHLLELYPVLETIQKYLWPRLCKLDQRTLYELHYQMITFGKVFCTKNKPNCNACPMRGECRHFASAFASARLALPGPEEKSMVSSTIPIASSNRPAMAIKPLPLPPSGSSEPIEMGSIVDNCEPIVEEPSTPEPEIAEVTESDIEDAFYEDPDEIPTIKLNLEEFTLNLHNYMQENMELQESDMSKALVALNPEAASIPTPKLKNVSRLRTEHQVYELPDSHPLLKWMDKREPDDPSPYLLAIWTPGETANSVQPPESRCGSQEPGKLCNEKTCFSCNSARETNAQTVRGTLLIPCRTAMRGSFPLNGTYFQVNEMFADHESSLNPIHVPRAWIWNLPRRTVYFGTSVSSIFKGLPTEGIQYCFWRGFVCVRGFDQKTRAPRPLLARLHFPASKLVKTRNEDK